jgi:hypothetical protein
MRIACFRVKFCGLEESEVEGRHSWGGGGWGGGRFLFLSVTRMNISIGKRIPKAATKTCIQLE